MKNRDIKNRLRQSASSIDVPDNMQATFDKLPDTLTIIEPKRKKQPNFGKNTSDRKAK